MISTHLGDCLDILPTIPDGSVDMVLCDLPYGTTGHRWDTPIDLPRLWAEYSRVCKRNAAVLLFAKCPFSATLGASNLKNLRYDWTWEKAPVGHLSARRAPMRATESILVFFRAQPTYNPQGLIPFEGLQRPNLENRLPRGNLYTGRAFRAKEWTKSATNFPRDILRGFPRETGLHPTQKPVALLEYLIRTYTNEGETVLDNTMGSGSTLVAALRSGRRSIGIERDPGYYEIACERLAREQAHPLEAP